VRSNNGRQTERGHVGSQIRGESAEGADIGQWAGDRQTQQRRYQLNEGEQARCGGDADELGLQPETSSRREPDLVPRPAHNNQGGTEQHHRQQQEQRA